MENLGKTEKPENLNRLWITESRLLRPCTAAARPISRVRRCLAWHGSRALSRYEKTICVVLRVPRRLSMFPKNSLIVKSNSCTADLLIGRYCPHLSHYLFAACSSTTYRIGFCGSRQVRAELLSAAPVQSPEQALRRVENRGIRLRPLRPARFFCAGQSLLRQGSSAGVCTGRTPG